LIEEIRQLLAGTAPTPAGELPGMAGDLPSGLMRIRPRRLVAAAVLVPIVARDEPTVLLTQRHPDLKHHGGQVSFPGGRIETGDSGPVEAALRETREETGIDEGLIEVLGFLENYRTLTGYSVSPVVGLVDPDYRLQPDPREVDAVFEVPLGFLMDPRNRVRRTRRFFGYEVGYFEITWDDYRIWGATASMLIEFLERLTQVAGDG